MPAPSSPRLLTLHGLRLKGSTTAADLARLWELSPAVVDEELASAGDAGVVTQRDDAWSLHRSGRVENERLLADEVDAVGVRTEVEATYDRFLDLNPRMLEVCTAWQVRDLDTQTLNDHLDPAYDAEVIDRLGELDEAVRPLCVGLAGHLDRFGIHAPRFATAMARLRAGDHDWFTKPVIESHHTVWFELHEDLLATLGIDRVRERDLIETRERAS